MYAVVNSVNTFGGSFACGEAEPSRRARGLRQGLAVCTNLYSAVRQYLAPAALLANSLALQSIVFGYVQSVSACSPRRVCTSLLQVAR